MTMWLSQIESWDVGSLRTIADELTTELGSARRAADQLGQVALLPGWESPAADVARERVRTARAHVLDDAAVLGAVQQLAEETAAAVTKLQNDLAAIRDEVAASDGHLRLSDSGRVTIIGTAKEIEQWQGKADDIEARAQALLRLADDIDADGREVFGNIEAGKVTAAGAPDYDSAYRAGEQQSGLSAPYPPEGGGTQPRDVTAWWNSLTPEEQAKVQLEHPDWLDRDGVPAPIRHGTNLPAMERDLAAAQAALDAHPSFEQFRAARPDLSEEAARAAHSTLVLPETERLNEIRGVHTALLMDPDRPELGFDPDKFLMHYEPGEHEVLAVIATGNPDEATHVTVATPGMNTHADSLPAMVGEAGALKTEMERQLNMAGKFGESVSTIAWFGYDPPDTSDLSVFGAASEDRANAGAVDLASFYRGINATNVHGSDVHLSAFGHSYGSTTTAQALNELGEKGVVDDAVFYGSPGLGHANEKILGVFGTFINDEDDLFLDQGRGYVMSADQDWVSQGGTLGGVPLPGLADVGTHGPRTTTLPLEQLSTAATTTPDGVARDGAVGHSEYPRTFEVQRPDGTQEQLLRTTGYNLAIVGAGLADERDDLLVRK